jgi:hypothetical protein
LEVTVRAGSGDDLCLANLMRDPLIRLVMKSDGVTERVMVALLDQVRRSLIPSALCVDRCNPTSLRD